MTKKQLWVRLKKYRFQNLVPISLSDRIKDVFGSTDAFTLAFAAKVAKKHGWSDEFAFLAVREYKKFVFLGVTSHYEVTPSRIIDAVWHEHSLFTKGYREFCENVLEQYFDHSPELVPFDEQNEVFNAQYRKTLAYYEHEFGTEPPEEIWGKPKFDPVAIKRVIEKPPRKQSISRRDEPDDDSDIPIFSMFSSGSDAPYAPIPVTFSGHGGTFGGGGASGSWSEQQSHHSTPDTSSHTAASSCSSSTSGCSSSSSCGGGGD